MNIDKLQYEMSKLFDNYNISRKEKLLFVAQN